VTAACAGGGRLGFKNCSLKAAPGALQDLRESCAAAAFCPGSFALRGQKSVYS